MAVPPATAQSVRQTRPQTTFALSGCRPVPLSCAEIADYDGRYEYWEADTELAWVLRDTSPNHEHPRTRLVELVKDIAKMRGTPIAMYGTADLQERDAHGARLRAAEADELIFLDCPEYLPEVFVVGAFRLPDVVFEVDLTTDIRDRKLELYASWGIPELWVEVPDAHMPNKRKRPGLTIHVFEDGRFRQRAESVAFPTWTASEIHTALNERFSSAITVGTLRRVGETMGRLVGTGPEDDPFLSAERHLSRLAGWREGLLEERLSTVEGLLRARNIHVTGELNDAAGRIAAMPREAVLQAALESGDLDDFLRRLRPER